MHAWMIPQSYRITISLYTCLTVKNVLVGGDRLGDDAAWLRQPRAQPRDCRQPRPQRRCSTNVLGLKQW